MTTIFTMTLNTNGQSDGETQASERANIAMLMEQVRVKLQSGAANSETDVYDHNGNSVGSWTYTPVASS